MIRKEAEFIKSTNGKNKLHVMRWQSERVNAILQISHGMVEHIERYDRFATYLAEKGIMVVGNDHLGHGKSVDSEEEYGFFATKDGSKIVVDDLYEVTKYIKEQYKEVPYFVLGHSMGSFMIRRYIMTYGNEVDGAIIMGTGQLPNSKLAAASTILNVIKRKNGIRHRSELMNSLGFGGYNRKFEPARTDKDWLTRDEKIVDLYRSDERCRFTFTVNGYETIFDTMRFIAEPSNINQIPKELPILFVAGEKDPVGDFGKTVKKIYESYKVAGVKDVSIKLYPEDRHEIINELDYETVYEDIFRWIEKERNKKEVD